ncbi:hypothetical protein [Candidatus Methanoprimaticola sp. MG2]|uniref:hypothetical protein n=1 Tax=Candidatus Methanoprimaticola sp. MG2 TaxID=3228838 RepID=UPI0039C60728
MVDADVTLYKDIGLYPDYSKSMYFTSKTQQTNWFNSIPSSKKVELYNVNYNKIHNAFRVHEPVGDVYAYTYIRIRNMDDSGRVYYGFVSAVTLIDDETTEFTIDLDALQTFMCEWSLGECLVSREHVDRWSPNENHPIYTAPNEDIFSGYVTANVKEVDNPHNYKIGITALTYNKKYKESGVEIAEDKSGFVMFFASILSPNSDTIYGKLTYYSGGGTDEFISAIPYPSYEDFIDGSYITRAGFNPEQIIGSWILPIMNTDFYADTAEDIQGTTRNTVNIGAGGWDVYHNEGAVFNKSSSTGYMFAYADTSLLSMTKIITFNWLDDLAYGAYTTLTTEFDYPSKPTSPTNTKSTVYEPMLYTSPIMKRGICKNDGQTLLEIPDISFLNSTGIEIDVYTDISTQSVNNLIIARPDTESAGYNFEILQNELIGAGSLDQGVHTDMISNEWLSYVLTQRDSDRQVMKSNMITNAVTNMIGMGYGGALVGSRSNSGRNDPMSKKGGGDVAGFRKGMMMASVYGMATGAVTSLVQGYDMWVQQQAKESSIKNQPSTLLSTSNGIASLFRGTDNYFTYETKIDEVNYNKAFNNYVKYGYMVNRIETPNIQSRYYFNYICTLNTSIKGSLSSDIKQALVNIFERGITLFHADHCNTTEYPIYENIERSLL